MLQASPLDLSVVYKQPVEVIVDIFAIQGISNTPPAGTSSIVGEATPTILQSRVTGVHAATGRPPFSQDTLLWIACLSILSIGSPHIHRTYDNSRCTSLISCSFRDRPVSLRSHVILPVYVLAHRVVMDHMSHTLQYQAHLELTNLNCLKRPEKL